MKGAKWRSWVLIVISMALALAFTNAAASPQPCEVLYNFCQSPGGCQGEAILIVYGGGGYAIQCINPQNPFCREWTQPCI